VTGDARASDLDLAAFMHRVEDAAALAALAPSSSIGACLDPARTRPLGAQALASAAASLSASGWLALEDAVASAEARTLAAAVDALVETGVPPLFVYAYDAPWSLGAALARDVTEITGTSYELLADAWAFRIAVGPEHRGWRAHRGSYARFSDRRAPDLVNAWVALTDADVDNGCMHVVELDDDAGYRSSELARLDDAATLARAKALPARAGTALAWNANVLHWGGSSSERARAPRTSITFTLRRADRPEASTTPTVDLARLDFRARLDLVADQILAYGDLERGFPAVARRWASLTVALRNRR